MSKNKSHQDKRHKQKHANDVTAVKAKTDSSEQQAAMSLSAGADARNSGPYESAVMSSALNDRPNRIAEKADGNEWEDREEWQEPYTALGSSGMDEDPFEQDAEFASEVAYPVGGVDPDIRFDRRSEAEAADAGAEAGEGRAIGWFGLVLAVISLFIWPAVIGTIAAIIGVVAYARGSRGLGAWTIGIGLVSILAYFFLVPYYA